MADESCSKTPNLDGDYPTLGEYPLQSNLLYLIPAQAQKGLTTFDIEFTCIDADGHFLAIGSNVGIVYLYDRIKNHLSRLRNDHKDAITCVKVLLSLECLVVFGCKNGAVCVFKIPLGTDEELEKFTVEGLHSSPITSLEWVKNGMKFFSGDEAGVVVCTEIDHFEHQSRSRVLTTEQSKIVQLSYSRMSLIISTLFRSIIYSCEDGSITKIGLKERKCFGPFGAIICNESNSSQEIVFASRPGQRLWKSDKSGVIHETMIFKNALAETHPVISLLGGENDNFCDFQFGKLARYCDKYIVVSSDSALVLIDPDLKSVVSSCPKLDPVVDVSICNDEIFVLRGLRHLVRISSSPDPYACEKAPEEPSLIEDMLIPFKGLSTFVREHSNSFTLQPENTIFDWLKRKRSASSPAATPVDYHREGGNDSAQRLPDVVKLQSDDCIPVKLDKPILTIEVPKVEIKINMGNESDDIVYKPKKKHKKKVRFRSVSPRKPERKPLDAEPEQSENNKDNTGETQETEMPNNKLLDSTDTAVPTESASSQETNSKVSNLSEPSVSSICSTTIDNLDNNQAEIATEKDLNFNNSAFTRNEEEQNLSNEGADLSDIKTDDCDSSSQNESVIMDQSSNNNERTNDPDDIYSSIGSTESNLKDCDNLSQSSTFDSQLSDESLTTSLEVAGGGSIKYGGDWVEYKAPELLLDVSVSNDHIFCVDVRNRVLMSNHPVLGLQWRELDQPAEKIAVSPTESIVWVLYKGTVYAAVQKSDTEWKEVEWISVARDVVSITVDEDCGWYVSSNGGLFMQPNLNIAQPYGYPQSIACEKSISQVCSWNKVVWILTVGGAVFCSYGKKSKYQWKEISLNGVSEVGSIFLGIQDTGWIIDSFGIIRFMVNVTPEMPRGSGKLYEVEASKYFVGPSNQLQKVVSKALNNELLTSLIKGKQQIHLSTSPSGIWFCKTMDNLLYSNQNNVIGHMWDSVIPMGTTSTSKWRLLAATGVLNSQGSIWCLNSAGDLFCFCPFSNTLVAVELPLVTGIQDIMPTSQSLWLLSDDGTVFVRRGITQSCLEGVWWQRLDLAQFNVDQLIHISCSPEISWGCTNSGRVLLRLGSLCPSSDRKLPQAWIPIDAEHEENFSPLLGKVYVGPLGHPVWSLDTRGSVYVREGVTNSFPLGKKWIPVPELYAKELAISTNAVWLLKHSGKIFRRFGVTEKNPCGDYWKQIPGRMDHLSVTEDDDLWGLKDSSMFLHSSIALNCTQTEVGKKQPVRSISEEDWEDIMVDASDSDS